MKLDFPDYAYKAVDDIPTFPDHGPVAIMDAQCGVCTKTATWMAHADTSDTIRIIPMQSELGQKLFALYEIDADDPTSWLLLKHGKAYISFEAILQVCETLGGIWKFTHLARILPRTWRDALYNLVARNRYRIAGKADMCAIPDPEVQKRLLT
jgi:predicted DCC family thiol-disulfide oxidoreductase YuxK